MFVFVFCVCQGEAKKNKALNSQTARAPTRTTKIREGVELMGGQRRPGTKYAALTVPSGTRKAPVGKQIGWKTSGQHS